MTRRLTLDTQSLAAVAALALVATALLTERHALAVAMPAVAGGVGRRRRDFLVLVGWILVGALAGGALGWGVAQVGAPNAATIAAVFGAAIGGGFAAVIRLFVFASLEPQEPESVTIQRESADEETVPDPEPIDLFDGNPDPVLYFDDAGDGPVVRAANPAFEETFGVAAETVENAALADALMVTDKSNAIVTAAGNDEAFDAVLDCETGDEMVRFRVRTTTIESITGTRGYVLYTPVETAD